MKKRHYSLVLSLFISLLVSISQVGHAMESEKVAAFDDKKTIDLMGAAIDKYLENTNKLLAQYAPNGIAHKDADGLTPLMKAVNAGDRKIFDAICMVGDSLHLHDNQGRTAYYYATEKLDGCAHVGHEHCCPFVFMKERLEGGINEVDPSNDMTPLMTAAQAGNMNMVLWLLGHGADIKKVGNYNKTKTAYNVAKDEAIKKILEFKGAKEFEAQHLALQEKKREEIRLKLLQGKQKKEANQAQIHSDALYEERVEDYLKNDTMAVKSFLFGAIFSLYKETINHHLDPAVIECKKDLLQRVFIRLLLTCKNKGHAPEQVQQMLGDTMTHMVMQAGCFLGEKRLALMGCKKKGPLAFSELVRLVYAQDKKITRESDKIDADIDIILFMSHWKKTHPLLLKESGEGAQITFQQAHNMLLQAGDNNKPMKPEQMQFMLHVQNEIYKLFLQDYPRAVQAVAAAQDSFGNTPLHYAVLFEDFELAKELMLAKAGLSKQNIKKITSLELILKMGNSDKLKDLLAIKCNDITHQLRKAVPTELEIRDLVAKAPPAAGAGAGRHDVMRKDMKKDFDHVQENLKKDILSAAFAKVPVSSSNTVVIAQPDAEKLAQAQKAQELAAAQLAKEQEAQKIAKMAAKQAAKKERRKATKMGEEQAIEELKRDAERKRHADELLTRNKKAQQRAEQDKAQANRALEEVQLHEQKRKLELEKREQAQKRRIEVQNKLEQTQSQAQASKLELEKQLQESAAQKIYFQHVARPDIYADDQVPTHYAQWLHEHRLAEGAYCMLCNKASVIKAQIYKEDAVQEQLQRRKAPTEKRHVLLTQKEIERIEKEFEELQKSQQSQKLQVSKEQIVAHLQALEQQRQAAEQQRKEDELRKKQADKERYDAHFQILNPKLQEAEQQRKERESKNKEGLQKSFNTLSQQASQRLSPQNKA